MENSRSFELFVIFGLISLVFSQNHGDTTASVSCYKCHGATSGDESFPRCLDVNPVTCSTGQGCRVTYTTDWRREPVIGCSALCSRYDRVPSTACPYGGLQTALRQCDVCTTDNTRVNQITTQLMEQAPVTCPTQCTVSHPEDCWKNAQICGTSEFCQLDIGQRIVQGTCLDRKTFESSCLLNVFTKRCPSNLLGSTSASAPDQCYIDCCTDNNCVTNYFGTGAPSSTLPTTPSITTTTATTMATTAAPYNVYSQLVQECRDHLEPGVCKDLKATQDLCQSSGAGLHLDLCPETCGVCQAIQEANCHDTVLDGECAKLIAEKDICNGALARYTCPATCGLCDILVEEKLVIILAAMSASTQPPTFTVPTTQPPDTTVPTTQPPTFTVPTTQPPDTTVPTTQPPDTTVPTTQPPTSFLPTTPIATIQA